MKMDRIVARGVKMKMDRIASIGVKIKPERIVKYLEVKK